MAAQVVGVFEENLRQKILESKILVVGAGGIGCEILKNLVLCGFPNIEIIDLDTIEVSNLNRQFLFHKEHVGKSKAEIARDSALQFNPNVNIKAYHDSITTTNYGVTFYQKFNLVLNALDNRQARNHVNRMCLTANIPLIESGTAGYNGQVELIRKGVTQCYECTPKQGEKSYPGCTIRNTPSEPIHCIVWAKYLFNQLFGEVLEDEDVSPDTADPELTKESKTHDDTPKDGELKRINTRMWAENEQYDPEKLFNKLFYDDIKYLLCMSKLWEKRTPPEPIKWEDASQLTTAETADQDKNCGSTTVLPDQKIWNISECTKIFANSVKALRQKLSQLPANDHLVWDKDDKNAMDFVAACANVRSKIFKINMKSRFDIKSMAGRIIPAIATTNAITAGIVVMHAFKVLQEEFDKCKAVYLRLRPNARNQLFVPDKTLNPPNPKCLVCSGESTILLQVDTNRMTGKEFYDEILIKTLNTVKPDVTVLPHGAIIISSEDDEDGGNDYHQKKLKEIQLFDGTIIEIDDFFQNYSTKAVIIHKDAERDEPLFKVLLDSAAVVVPPEDTKPAENGNAGGQEEKEENAAFVLNEKIDEEKSVAESIDDKEQREPEAKKRKIENNHLEDDSDDDDICIIEDSDDEQSKTAFNVAAIKRKNDPGEGPSTLKRAKIIAEESDSDLIILDD